MSLGLMSEEGGWGRFTRLGEGVGGRSPGLMFGGRGAYHVTHPMLHVMCLPPPTYPEHNDRCL